LKDTPDIHLAAAIASHAAAVERFASAVAPTDMVWQR
jgi:hypothetical protein